MPQYPYDAPVGYSYAHISNAGTVVVKASAGAVNAVNINGGATGAALEMFDNNVTVTGTVVIANMTLGATALASVPYAVEVAGNGVGEFKSGLVVVSTGTIDATIWYR